MIEALPSEIRKLIVLVRQLGEPQRGQLIEQAVKYRYADPHGTIRYARSSDPVRVFYPHNWSYLFEYPLGDYPAGGHRYQFAFYKRGICWLYRGPVMVERDLFGPVAVRIVDELRLCEPVIKWPKKVVDTKNEPV